MVTMNRLVKSNNDKTLGNHKVIQSGNISKYFYYVTCICQADHTQKIFSVDSSYGTRSTTQACNSYRREFMSMGYVEVINVCEVCIAAR